MLLCSESHRKLTHTASSPTFSCLPYCSHPCAPFRGERGVCLHSHYLGTRALLAWLPQILLTKPPSSSLQVSLAGVLPYSEPFPGNIRLFCSVFKALEIWLWLHQCPTHRPPAVAIAPFTPPATWDMVVLYSLSSVQESVSMWWLEPQQPVWDHEDSQLETPRLCSKDDRAERQKEPEPIEHAEHKLISLKPPHVPIPHCMWL